MMNIGIISSRRYDVRYRGAHWKCHSFLLAPSEPSFDRIFDCAFATPARYLIEIYRRVYVACGDGNGPVLAFNPLFDLSPAELWLVLDAARDLPVSQLAVVADRANAPIAYLLPSACVARRPEHLGLLSSVDAKLDRDICSHLFGSEAGLIAVDEISAAGASNNGFHLGENERIYRWIGERALSTLRGLKDTTPESVPFAAIMPHHAGDVLFFALAWRRNPFPVQALVVNKAYRQIADDNAGELALIPIDEPPLNRGSDFSAGKVTPEGQYFWTYAPTLPSNYFYSYLRISRDYNATRYHLLDHFAFALGASCLQPGDLMANESQHEVNPQAVKARPARPDTNILLFFDGGWLLKIYPEHDQIRLIQMLKAGGYHVTVLAPQGRDYPECEVRHFESYGQLKVLLASQHMVVGMDSFPTHLAAHVLQVPTICLFGSTRPENADVPVSPRYRSMEKGVKCRPCYGFVTCPLYGGGNCRNFVSPEAVVEAVEHMLSGVQDLQPSSKQSPADPTTPARRRRRRTHRIDLRFGVLRRPMYTFILRAAPGLKLLSLLRSEFARSLERDGLQATLIRSLLFVRKVVVGREGR